MKLILHTTLMAACLHMGPPDRLVEGAWYFALGTAIGVGITHWYRRRTA